MVDSIKRHKRGQSLQEEIANSVSHGVALAVAFLRAAAKTLKRQELCCASGPDIRLVH
jgi:predicted membrane channel-forming protein YqfA (hemolysin III family)